MSGSSLRPSAHSIHYATSAEAALAQICTMACTARRVDYFYTAVTDQPGEAYKLLKTFADLVLDGPHPALLVQGDDALGALADLHMKLADARVNVYASTGLADGKGCFGYIIYVRPEEFDRAIVAVRL